MGSCRSDCVGNPPGFVPGQIYIGLPYEESDPRYCQLRDHLENPDGTMRDSHVTFYVISLQLANMNVHHDEPGFWERWGENL